MNPEEIISRASARGVTIGVKAGRLCLKPANRVPPELLEEVRQAKPQLLDWLNHKRCPGWGVSPPINLALNLAELQPTVTERELLIAYILRQGCDRPGPLTEWLVRRELAYYDGPGKQWDCGLLAYAAARDAVCWQIGKNEREAIGCLAELAEATKEQNSKEVGV